MTARNVQSEAKRKGLPWSIAKGFDTFLPVSGFVAKAALPDPHAAELELRVDGAVRQRGPTALMLFRVARQLADVSAVMTLEPGDLLLTGTPSGVGPVGVGDVMRAVLRGREGEELADIEVAVEDKGGRYRFAET